MKRLTIFMTNNVFPVSKSMSYGGERIVLYLVEELAKRHDVYCFMRDGSDFTGIPIKEYIPVEPMNDQYDVHFKAAVKYSLTTGIEPDVYFCGYFGKGNPDVFELWPYAELTWCKWTHAKYEFPVNPFNIISYSNLLQEDLLGDGVPSTKIYYGLPENLYQFQPDKENYACWIGKLEGGKAPRTGIELAKAAGLKIVVMGPPYNSGTFWNEVAPYIDDKDVFWVRGVDDAMKYEIMSKAKCLLYTNNSTWREHAGIIMLEAMAMGTPVVGMSMTQKPCSVETDQFIKDGVNGFVLHYSSDNLDEIIDTGVPLINQVHTIDPKDCRDQFESRFTAELMARRYEWFFDKIKDGSRFGSVEVPF